jgi:hypothetical protein
VVGFLRKTDASVRAYHAKRSLATYYWLHIILATYYCREVYRCTDHGCATVAVIKKVLMIMISKWLQGFRSRVRIYETAHLNA